MGKKQMKQKKGNKKRKKKRWKKVLIFILIILLAAGGWFGYKVHQNGGGLSGMLATVIGHDENTKKNLGEFKVLLLGISTDQEGVELTDTIMVASYNPNTQKATLLSIPRDTYVGKNPSRATAYEKINSLYGRKHRANETLEAVNEITGLNIEYYAVIKTEALIKLVDVIGGITFNVPINMDYDDPTQDLHIHLKAGEQELDGDKAEQLVRFRHNNNGTSYPEEYGDNDIGRMKTQREFILQVIKQTATPGNIFKLGEILEVAKQYVETNVDFNVIKDYIPYVVEFNTENLLTDNIPGEPSNNNSSGTWIFIHNKTKTKQLVEKLFFNRDIEQGEEGSADSDTNTTNTLNTTNTSNTTNTTNTTSSTSSYNKSGIKIEILNGSGESDSLQKLVNQLKGAGFKITRTGSTNTTTKTTIANRNEVKDVLMKNIKDVIGVGDILESKSSSSKVDITIIIGKDYV